MTPEQRKRMSKFLSYVLRHQPDAVGLELDRAGWAPVDVLLVRATENGQTISHEQLLEVVETNDKRRCELSVDGAMIRARQGHSVPVQLGYEVVEPPELLYHGTAARNLASIRAEGLSRGKRHHVHLSTDRELMRKVGQRHGRPVLLSVEARRMHEAGYRFYRTGNDVWLTEHVPPEFIAFPDKDRL